MAVDLARLQFAITTSLHFLFVILTLGLGPLVAVMETRFVLTGKPVFERMTRFWGQIYVINYVLGILVGLSLEFQFGMNWSGLVHFAGDVFGTSLAMETLVAFFVESTFLGIWIFGWGRLPRAVHAAVFWVVVLTAYTSVFWILTANGFLQHPVGHRVEGDRLELVDYGALLTNEAAVSAILHIIPVVLATAGFFVAGVSAWHFRRGTEEVEFFRRSMKLGLVVAGGAGFLVAVTGYSQLDVVQKIQPIKWALLWGEDSGTGPTVEQLQAQAVARYGPGDYTPPEWVAPTFKVMTYIGSFLFEYLFWLPLAMAVKTWVERRPWLLRLLVWTIPIPFIAAIAGWLVREVGRQPWLVYGYLRTEDGVSPVGTAGVLTSLILFSVLFIALAVVDYLLIARLARSGPEAAVLGRTLPAAATAAESEAGKPGDGRLLRL